MSLYKKIHDYAGMKVNGISFNIDIVQQCVLACPTCGVGSIGKRRAATMTYDFFVEMMDKARRECKVRKIQFYAYSEAAMHPELHRFVQYCADHKIVSHLSTMLQTTKCDWAKVIEARPTEMRISFPGWEKMEYYQKNAKPALFDANIEKVCALPRHPETTWTMAWHLYNDNGHEYARVKELADKHKLKLVVLPAIFMPLEKNVENNYSEQDKETISHLIEHPAQSVARMKREYECDMHKQITIDAHGMVMLCQLVFQERFKIAPFMAYPVKEILKRIRSHSFCGTCMKAGGNVYQKCFADFVTSDNPIADADKRRRLSEYSV